MASYHAGRPGSINVVIPLLEAGHCGHASGDLLLYVSDWRSAGGNPLLLQYREKPCQESI